jgi:hypothetical protein
MTITDEGVRVGSGAMPSSSLARASSPLPSHRSSIATPRPSMPTCAAGSTRRSPELAAETFAHALRSVARYDEERADALP